jgi:hypothetical protein
LQKYRMQSIRQPGWHVVILGAASVPMRHWGCAEASAGSSNAAGSNDDLAPKISFASHDFPWFAVQPGEHSAVSRAVVP